MIENKTFRLISILMILAFTVCCATAPKLSPMQKRQLTSKLIEADYENAYRACLTVLQDQGYIIKNTDMNSGLIVASVDRESSLGSQFSQAFFVGYVANRGSVIEVSCMLNKISDRSTEIRMNIQEVTYGQSSEYSGTGKQGARTIYDEEVYQNLFNEITVEVKRREAMQK